MSFIKKEMAKTEANKYLENSTVSGTEKSYLFEGFVDGFMTGINTHTLSARDRGTIDEIIKALEALEQDKMLCYADEIGFLKRIREW